MHCRNCSYSDSRVIDTTHDDRLNKIIRRRECIKCGMRFSTQENLRENPNYQTPAPRRILEK